MESLSFMQRLRMGLIDLARGTRILGLQAHFDQGQWLQAQDLAEKQNQGLAGILSYAVKSIPFYRRFDSELHDLIARGQVRSALRSLPVMTKQMMRDRRQFVPVNGYGGREFTRKTGGSTGDPFHYQVSSIALSSQWAAVYRAWEWAGYRFGMPMATVGGGSVSQGCRFSFSHAVYDWLRNNHSLAAGKLSEADLSTMASYLAKIRPVMLYGYPTLLYELAAFLRRGKISPPALGCIVTTSEMLFPGQRGVLEQAFGCPVFDMYGCNEPNLITAECPLHSGFHVATETSFVEILDEGGSVLPDGEVGRIVATSLNNRAMPFIRYDTGDLGALEGIPCRCGRHSPRIINLHGRSRDLVLAGDGSVIHGVAFNQIALKFPWIDRYQLIQSKDGDLTLNLACEGGAAGGEPELVANSFSSISGRPVQVILNGTFETTAGLKARVIISHMEGVRGR